MDDGGGLKPDNETFHDAMNIPDDEAFHDTQEYYSPKDGHFFDPSNSLQDLGFVGWAFHLLLDPTDAID